MSSVNFLDQSLIQAITVATRSSTHSTTSALLAPLARTDSSQTRGLQGLAAEIGTLAGTARQAQATILGAGKLESVATSLLPKLRELRNLARQGTAEGLTAEERKTLAERFTALQDEINKEAGEDTGGTTLVQALNQTAVEDGAQTGGARVTLTGTRATGAGVVEEAQKPLAESQVARDRGLSGVTVAQSDTPRVVRFTDTGNGQIQATLLEQTDTGLVEIGNQTVAGPSPNRPQVLSFDRLGMTASLNEGYTAGDLNRLEVTITPASQTGAKVNTSTTSATLLDLSIADQTSAGQAMTRLDQTLAQVTSLRTRAHETQTEQRQLILQAAQALVVASGEQGGESDRVGNVLQSTRSQVLQQSLDALTVQGNILSETAVSLLT